MMIVFIYKTNSLSLPFSIEFEEVDDFYFYAFIFLVVGVAIGFHK